MNIDLENELKIKLYNLGFILNDQDLVLLKHYYEKTEAYFKGFCHIKKIPDELMPYLKDHCCGLFIENKTFQDYKNNTVHSAKIGDINLTFSNNMSNNINLSKSLLCPKEVLLSYRKMNW